MSRLVVTVLAAGLITVPIHAQKPPLADVLELAATYHAAYVVRASGAALEEQYKLIQLLAGKMQTPVHFTSDLVLVNVNGRLTSLRDPFALDNVSLRERAPRITNLLAEPTTERWDRAQRLAAEQHFRFVSDLIIRLNDPVLALQFLGRDLQPKVTFKLEKYEAMNGVPVAKVGFKENGDRRETRFTIGTRGNAAASGRFWIDTATGAVHKSELWADSPNESVVVNVTFARDAALDLWLPSKMAETYQWKEMNDVNSTMNIGPYGARLFFQCSATYTNARHTPIDLTKMRR